MQRYIAQRLLLAIPTLLGVTLLVFTAIRLLPGDAVSMMIQDYQGYAKDLDDLRDKLGLSQPYYQQYLNWIAGMLHGNFGVSLQSQRPVAAEVAARIPVTAELGGLGFIISLLIAIPLGVYSAVRQDTIGDYLARSGAIAMLAIPGFWLGTLAITMPSIWWRWTPPLTYTPLLKDPGKNLLQMIVPAIILGIGLSGGLMRLMRAQMLEVLRQDYLRTVKSKGFRDRYVVIHHAIKNSIIPVVTLMGVQIAFLIGGTVVLESIFVIPGMGRYLLEAVSQRDYPAVQAVVVIFATVIILVNLAVDLLYAWLDPRIRYS